MSLSSESVQKQNLILPGYRAQLQSCCNNTPLPRPVFLDGFTHWSLTGTLVTDEDTFMGFNDGLSQSGTRTAQTEMKEQAEQQAPACMYRSELLLEHQVF